MKRFFSTVLITLVQLSIYFNLQSAHAETTALCEKPVDNELSGVALFSSAPKSQLVNPISGAAFPVYLIQPNNGLSSYKSMVLVPGGTGGAAGLIGRAEQLRSVGILSILFDPDGRGLAEGQEDQGGSIHQAALAEVIRMATQLPCVDNAYLGIFTNSYGITMGAGALSAEPDLPVTFLVDWEGPANRNDTGGCDDSKTGHLQGWRYERDGEVFEVTCDDEVFWSEREASTSIRNIEVPYLRLQSRRDHVQPDHAHTILMINEALSGKVPSITLNYHEQIHQLEGIHLPSDMLLDDSLEDLSMLVDWVLDFTNLQPSSDSIDIECALHEYIAGETATSSRVYKLPSINSETNETTWSDNQPINSLSSYSISCDLPPNKILASLEIQSTHAKFALSPTACKAKTPQKNNNLQWREAGLTNADPKENLTITCPVILDNELTLEPEVFDVTLKAAAIDNNEEIESASAPIFITTMTHLEGNWDFSGNDGKEKFDQKILSIELAMDTFEKYDALLTIESEIPFSTAAIEWSSDIFQAILNRGHGAGTHCDISPLQSILSIEEFSEQFRQRKVLMDTLIGVENNLGCSGGQGFNDWILGASAAGFKFIDGIVGYAFLSMPLENRPVGWTNDYIIEQGHYHDNVPVSLAERIHPFMMEDASDFTPDKPGRILLSAGGLGRLDGFADEERGETCRPRCSFEHEDIDAAFRRIDEALTFHDINKIGKIDIYFPLSSFTTKNISYIESFLSRLKDEYITRGKLQWGTQRAVYEAYTSLIEAE